MSTFYINIFKMLKNERRFNSFDYFYFYLEKIRLSDITIILPFNAL